MSHTNLELVKLKRSVEKIKSESDLIVEIISLLNQIPNVSQLLKDPELILYICNLIENNSYCGNKKLDKKDIAVKIVIQLNPTMNNDSDVSLIKNMIDFLHSNRKIKKLSEVKKYGGLILNWLKKKIC
jgi:hypothetical protein